MENIINAKNAIQNTNEISQSTKKNYIGIIKKLEEYCNNDFDQIIQNPEKFHDVIIQNCTKNKRNSNKSSGASTCREYINAIKAGIKYSKFDNKKIEETWKNHYQNLKIKVEQERNEKRKHEGNLSWKSIMEKLYELENKQYASLEHVTLALYTLIPPRRQLDYWKLYVQNDENDTLPEHYTGIIKPNGIIEVYQYKTAKTHGVFNKQLPEELLKIIKEYMKIKGSPSGFLITQKDNKDKTYNTVDTFTDANNNVLKKIFNNREISVNTIRHAASTFSDSLDYKTQIKVSKDMAHSMEMHEYYKNGVETKKEEEWIEIIKANS